MPAAIPFKRVTLHKSEVDRKWNLYSYDSPEGDYRDGVVKIRIVKTRDEKVWKIMVRYANHAQFQDYKDAYDTLKWTKAEANSRFNCDFDFLSNRKEAYAAYGIEV